jgi:hypothetical protein
VSAPGSKFWRQRYDTMQCDLCVSLPLDGKAEEHTSLVRVHGHAHFYGTNCGTRKRLWTNDETTRWLPSAWLVS